mmetsp:Transcript_28962/g.44510  ORF Transcript_28962/g.44510 Transcript_28962/m.44510 type:complete len:141 (-) Transcript_28962:584-1006(-)
MESIVQGSTATDPPVTYLLVFSFFSSFSFRVCRQNAFDTRAPVFRGVTQAKSFCISILVPQIRVHDDTHDKQTSCIWRLFDFKLVLVSQFACLLTTSLLRWIDTLLPICCLLAPALQVKGCYHSSALDMVDWGKLPTIQS